MTITRKGLFRTACFICAGFLLMLGLIVYGNARAASYRKKLETGVVYSLRQAASDMNELQVDLKKSAYAGTPAQLAGTSAKILKQSGEVKSVLAGMGFRFGELDGAYRFLSQVGDYSMYLSRRAGEGFSITEEERENIERLMEYSVLLTENLREIEQMISSGEIEASSLADLEPLLFPQKISLSGFDGVTESFEGYPSLIYDGPFSDHLLTKAPEMTANMDVVSRESARKIASGYAGIPEDKLLSGGDEVSRMPSYTFYSDGISVGVTINGGIVTYLSNARQISSTVVSMQEGRRKASEFLESHGTGPMQESYYELSSGVLTVNFAGIQDGVICYTDLIKVGVAMDNGEIVHYDARGFIGNYRERQFKRVGIPPEVARKSVSASLEVEDVRLALIPTRGENEVLTWEFLCKGMHGENVLVYVNADTGAEEQILVLIENENSKLTV